MLEAALQGFLEVFQWPALLFVLLGTLIGMLFGALPGLGGPSVLAVLIPLTFDLDATSSMVLLAAALGGVSFGGSIPAILLNAPGDSPNAATCFDGYPLARSGKAGLALGASAAASALGAIFGVALLMAILPFARSMILAFSYPEIFMLAMLGLSVIALLSTGNMLKGVAAGLFGVALSFVGQNPVTGTLRFTFGIDYFWDGIKLVPVIIGLFAICEALLLFRSGGSVASVADRKLMLKTGGVMAGVVAVFRNFGVFLRSSLIGTIVGVIPGVGGTVANFLAYGQAARTAKEPRHFGEGDVRGVIASEASNDSKDGGALLPSLAFGIPGSASMAVLLSGFIVHGIAPGPQLMRDHLDVVFALLSALILANVLTSLVGLGLARHIAWLTLVPSSVLSPLVIVISIVGAFSLAFSLGDILVAVAAGLVGFWFALNDIPRVPIIIGLILGGTVEQAFHFTLISQGAGAFFTRPISLALFVLVLVVLILPAVQSRRRRANQRRRASGRSDVG